MNQLIAKSTGEDINTNLLAVISTQESDMMLCTNWPLWIGSWQKEKEPYIWTAPISQTTLSQKNTFNGKCLVLAFCSRAVDFAAQRHSSSTVVCNIGWEQIIWKASNALCLCKLHEILTKLIYSRLFFFSREHTVPQLIQCTPTIIPQKRSNIFDLWKPGTRCNYSIPYIMFSIKQVCASEGCSACWSERAIGVSQHSFIPNSKPAGWNRLL